MEYQVRDARITDAERITSLLDAGRVRPASNPRATLGAADLLRQLVYLPQAVVLVAESHRAIVGAAVLALRPSVSSGGFVGSIDLLVVEAGRDVGGVRDALVAEVLRSARNKGCVIVEMPRPATAADQAAWEAYGFAPAPQRLVCDPVTARMPRSLDPVGP
ncbi:MAG TPA: hypothetical protein VIF84_06885 [Candidatus Limnocylindrales bacterium]